MLKFVLIVCFIAVCVKAQLGSKPQAKSPEEFDDFLQVIEQRPASEVVLAGQRFAKRWPGSALLVEVHRREMQAYRQLNNAPLAIEAGELVLRQAPDNIEAHAELSYLLANSAQDATSLTRAEAHAKRVLELVDVIRIPRTIAPIQWSALRSRLEAQAHTALGLVAFKRDLPKAAVTEFELAVRLSSPPEPALLYRLGLAYRITGDTAKATEMLQRAAKADDALIRSLAEHQLHK